MFNNWINRTEWLLKFLYIGGNVWALTLHDFLFSLLRKCVSRYLYCHSWLLVIRTKSPRSNRVVALSTIRRRRENPSERSGIGLTYPEIECTENTLWQLVIRSHTLWHRVIGFPSRSKKTTRAWSSVFLCSFGYHLPDYARMRSLPQYHSINVSVWRY